MLEEMSVSGGGMGGYGVGSASGAGAAAAAAAASGARAAGGGGGFCPNATLGSVSSGGQPSPPLSPMYSSPKGVSPRTNILPSFAWGKTMLKHLKRRPPGRASGSGGPRTAHGTGAIQGGAGGGGVGDGSGMNSGGRAGSGAGGGVWGAGGGGGAGMEGDGTFVYPAGLVQVRQEVKRRVDNSLLFLTPGWLTARLPCAFIKIRYMYPGSVESAVG